MATEHGTKHGTEHGEDMGQNMGMQQKSEYYTKNGGKMVESRHLHQL
jgi:hypothetical protein